MRSEPTGWHEIVSVEIMTATEKFNVVKRACDEQKVCQVKFRDELAPRLIHPLGVCLTYNRGLVIVCCVEGKDNGQQKADPIVSNLPIEDCDQIKIIEKKFDGWPDFITKSKICDDWLFHIPV
jgi:hypothetical protein